MPPSSTGTTSSSFRTKQTPEPTYFTCTLGQAPLYTLHAPFKTIPRLLHHHAAHLPSHPAIGFPSPSADRAAAWGLDTLFTFSELHRHARACARTLASQLPGGGSAAANAVTGPGTPVALLCSSTPTFLLHFLALVLLRRPALLLAPQLAPAAIAHLCRTVGAETVVCDDAHAALARSAAAAAEEEEQQQQQRLQVVRCVEAERVAADADEDEHQPTEEVEADVGEVAYLHHTSGTSSGLPKAIPQTHRAAVGALPRLEAQGRATFSTTPLYHGGVADMFRAWTSGEMIWLYPGGTPVTPGNVGRALEVCKREECRAKTKVRFFSAVPYVLEGMATDDAALEWLREMDAVGVGGAALTKTVGDGLVEKGVRLVSRFGSAECGFLLSSHRTYEEDREWQYLRATEGAESLRFEEREDGLAELVVGREWPHVAKKNREDGSYATGDLLEPHPAIQHAWRYHSRADAQLTLITGKKFDPAPLESALAASELLEDVLIFGSGKPYPGALLFRAEKSKDISDTVLVKSITKHVEILNRDSQSHARIQPSMLVPMPYTNDHLEKSSKGTIMRGKAETRYAQDIEQAYNSTEIADGTVVADQDVSRVLMDFVKGMIENDDGFDDQSDLFSFGIDSAASIRIRRAILDLIPPEYRQRVPATVVEDSGNVNNIVQFIFNTRSHVNGTSLPNSVDYEKIMSSLVQQWSVWSNQSPIRRENGDTAHAIPENSHIASEVVVLTGATGSLGAHVLNVYRRSPQVCKIYCLVRGADDEAAYQRINKALIRRKLPQLSRSDPKVVLIRVRLGETGLGLPRSTYDQIAKEATLIAHLAWAVNFRIALSSFVGDHIAGLHNLIGLALVSTKRARFVFCSSTASVANHDVSTSVPERFINESGVAGSLGYARSKWVAEQICRAAQETTELGERIAVVRVGQLAGDSTTGVWNENEAWPLLLSTVKETGCLPALKNERIDWLPVDVAAEAFAEISDRKRHEEPVYHLVNPHQKTDWNDVLRWMSKKRDFRTVEPWLWLQELKRLDNDHPAARLRDFWQRYAGDSSEKLNYDVKKTNLTSRTMKEVIPVDEMYFDKLWSWIDSQV